MIKQCSECGGAVKPVAIAGRTTRYKNIPNLEVPADIAIPTCQVCGQQWINDDVADVLTEALERVYVARLSLMAKDAINVLADVLPQRDLETKLALAQGYLTKLKNGVRAPSSELALNLASIAIAPIERLTELDLLLRYGFKAARQYNMQKLHWSRTWNTGTIKTPTEQPAAYCPDLRQVLAIEAAKRVGQFNFSSRTVQGQSISTVDVVIQPKLAA